MHRCRRIRNGLRDHPGARRRWANPRTPPKCRPRRNCLGAPAAVRPGRGGAARRRRSGRVASGCSRPARRWRGCPRAGRARRRGNAALMWRGRRDPTGGAPRAVLVVVKIRFQIQIQSIGMWPRHRCCTSRQDCARNANNCCRDTTVKWAAHKQLQRERSWPARVFIVKAGRRDAHQAERADNEAGEQRTAKDKIRHVRACALPSPLQSNREACASCGRRDDYRRPQKVSLVVHLGRAHVSHCKGTEQRSC